MSTPPLDIIETIIDVLAFEDDPVFSSTKTCALVCHDFLHLCRKHIFASIALGDAKRKARTTTPMLRKLLNTTPEIAHHIRNLDYCVTVKDLKDIWLLQTFKKITRLKSLSISHSYNIGPKYALQWNDTILRPVLLHLLHLPTLIHLDLCSVDNFIVTDLAPCINLKHFKFNYLTVLETDDALTLNLSETSLRLPRLSAGAYTTTVIMKMCGVQPTDQTPFLDFNSLTNLSMTITLPAEAEAARILFGKCRCLVNVNIRANFSMIDLSKLLQPSMQMLKHLHLATHFNQPGDVAALYSLCYELEQMRNNNVVETITIRITMYSSSDCRSGNEWAPLDQALTQPGWPKLELVSLTIIVQSFEYDSDHYSENGNLSSAFFQELPETQFPQLSSSKAFLFEFAVQDVWI